MQLAATNVTLAKCMLRSNLSRKYDLGLTRAEQAVRVECTWNAWQHIKALIPFTIDLFTS